MIWVLLALATSAWWVPTGRRRVRSVRPLGVVDPGVVLDLAIAALSVGVSIPSCLRAVDHALASGRDGDEERRSHRWLRSWLWKGNAEPRRDTSLSEVAGRLVMGASWSEAWEGSWEGFRRLRDALEPAWIDGAAPVPLLHRSAQTLRVTRARRAKEAAAKLGSQLVLPLGLCFLPAFICLGVVPVVVSFAQKVM